MNMCKFYENVYVYISVCVYVYVYKHVCMCIMYTCMCMCAPACVCRGYTDVYTNKYTQTCTCKFTYTHFLTYVWRNIHMHKYTLQTYTHYLIMLKSIKISIHHLLFTKWINFPVVTFTSLSISAFFKWNHSQTFHLSFLQSLIYSSLGLPFPEQIHRKNLKTLKRAQFSPTYLWWCAD